MIHLVFQPSDADVLRKAMALDPSLTGDILEIRDDYAVGPLNDPAHPGQEIRLDWWKQALEYSPYTDAIGQVNDEEAVRRLQAILDENPGMDAWIWMAQNAHDVCGYYWLIGQLKNYQGRIHVLYLNNLPFLNDKGHVFYPVYLFEILPTEFRKAKKLSRVVTPSEFEIDPDEWARLCVENNGIRILEGGKKIAGKDYSFYDSDLESNLTANWQKFSRVLSNTIHRMKIKTGDVFLSWRLREMIRDGKVELNGQLTKGWTACEVKRSEP